MRVLPRKKRKNGRTKVGPRAIVVFVVFVVVIGAIAISTNAKIEERESSHYIDPRDR